MGLLDRVRDRKSRLAGVAGAWPHEEARDRTNLASFLRERNRLVAERVAALEAPHEPPAAQIRDQIAAKREHSHALGDPSGYAEVRRILALPVVEALTPEEVEAVSRQELDARAYDRGERLFAPQAGAVLAFDQGCGPFCDVGVGWGKTGSCLLCALHAYRRGVRKILLLVPANAADQLLSRDIPWWRSRVSFGMPVLALDRASATSAERRLEIAGSQNKGLYVLTYSVLSSPGSKKDLEGEGHARKLLNMIAPQVLIADEAHYLTNPQAACTKRVLEYLDEHDCEFVALSGTMTRKRLRDHHHLAKHALREKCPLPLSASLAAEWGMVLDTDAEPTEAQARPIRPVVEWARAHYPSGVEDEDASGKKRQRQFNFGVEGFRLAFRVRRNSAPGVVSTGDAEIGVSLTISNLPVPDHKKTEGWPDLEELLKQLEEKWLTPNGDPIAHAIHTYKWAYELSAGFYNQLAWPTFVELAARRKIGDAEAQEILERARLHHEAERDYAKALRSWLKDRSRPGLDTPFLVGGYFERHGASGPSPSVHGLYPLWQSIRDLDFEGRPDRDSTAVRVCPFKVDHAVAWAKRLPRGEGALIWYYNVEVGEWLTEALEAAGVERVRHCPDGEQNNRWIVDPEKAAGHVVVASLTSHGQAKNLQHFGEQLYVQWPRSVKLAEQSIGRTHRNGQKRDELVVHTCHTLEFDHLNYAATLNDALYVSQTTGARQKVIYAAYDPTPRVFPTEVLRERGFQTEKLDAYLKDQIDERFGA